MICPCCNKEVDPEHFACKFASKGGAAGRGKSKARTSEQASAAVKARWRKKVIINQEPVIEPDVDPLHGVGG